MRLSPFVLALLAATLPPAAALAQPPKKDEADFAKEKPAIGNVLPELSIYSPDGKEFKTADLRGHYTVLTFGCLT